MGPGCDIYALGVILYQLLTGRLPFAGSIAEVLGQIVTQPPLPPSRYRPGLDPVLEAVCLKALSKKVADRYAGMREFGAALALYLRREPPRAALPVALVAPALANGRSSWPTTPRLGRKRLWLLLAAGAAAALLTASLLGITRSRGTIRIDLSDPHAEVEVQVDGDHIADAGMKEPLRLRPGKHHLLVTGHKIQAVSTSFSVARGDNPDLRVQLVPRAEAAADPAPPAPVTSRRRHEEDDDDHKERKGERKERKDSRYDN
jgi:hypothetical protein